MNTTTRKPPLRILPAAAILILLGSAHALAETECLSETPLPEPLEIETPGDDVPDEIARFAGVWSNGKWDDKLCHTLVVLSVDADGDAEAIYSYGRYPAWGIPEAEFFDPSGTIADGELELERFRNGARVTYRFAGDSLQGFYKRKGTSRVTLTKVQP